jgi:hypothetical protein
MGTKAITALGFALLVLLGAIAIPAAIDSRDKTEVESQQLSIGETGFYDEQLEISVIDSTQTEVTIRVSDIETGESEDITIPEGTTTTVQFSPGDVNITNHVSNNQGATLTVEYPSNYGFSPPARTIGDNLPIILISMFFIAVMAFVGVKP